MLAIADTHALIWYLLDDRRLSSAARSVFADAVTRGEPIGIPSICLVEIIYLTEKGRIPVSAFEALKQELEIQQTILRFVPLDELIALEVQKVDRTTVPDMPDRIITATALQLGLPLLSRDEKIRASGIATIW